jgi:hypothetical protein
VAEQTAWARDSAAALLAPLGRRWAHTLGVAERARSFAGVLPEGELNVLVAAAKIAVLERLADIASRYGDRDGVGRAIALSRHALLVRVYAVERALRSRCPG